MPAHLGVRDGDQFRVLTPLVPRVLDDVHVRIVELGEGQEPSGWRPPHGVVAGKHLLCRIGQKGSTCETHRNSQQQLKKKLPVYLDLCSLDYIANYYVNKSIRLNF